MTDYRPTIEELKEENDQLLTEDTPKDPVVPENPPADGGDSPETPAAEPAEETLIEEEQEEEQPAEAPPVPAEEPKKPVDFEKRYKDSSREAHILAEGKKQLEEQIDDAQNLPIPTEDEVRADLKADGIEFEDLSDFERKSARDLLHQKNINNKIREIRNEQKADASKIAARVSEVETFSIHPDNLKKYPKLEGRQEEFKEYASKPTRINLDLEDLAKLFILDLPVPVKNKGKMMESGSGGPNDKPKPKSDRISLEEAETLRERDYNKYKEYLLAGKIDSSIE